MPNIYIVTTGSYSDYSIMAVFDNKEAAEDYAKTFDANEVEVYPINSVNPYAGYKAFHVILCKDGTVESVSSRQVDEGDIKKVRVDVHDRKWNKQPPVIAVSCFARDEAHAIKIAGEKRSQAIAVGQL